MLLGGIMLALSLPQRFPTDSGDRTTGRAVRSVMSLLFDRNLLFPYGAVFAQYVSFGCIVAILPIHMSDIGLEALHVGMFLATISAVFMFWQLAMGRLSDRYDRVLPATLGLGIVVLCLILLPLPSQFSHLLVIAGFIGIGFGLVFPSICAMVVDRSRPGEQGRAMGVFHALLTAGVALGAPIGGALGSLFSIDIALLVIALPAALVLLLGVFQLTKS